MRDVGCQDVRKNVLYVMFDVKTPDHDLYLMFDLKTPDHDLYVMFDVKTPISEEASNIVVWKAEYFRIYGGKVGLELMGSYWLGWVSLR